MVTEIGLEGTENLRSLTAFLSRSPFRRGSVCICQNLEGFEWRSETRLQMRRIKADPALICHVVRATSEADRAKVAYCVRDLFEEGYFTYDKPWIKETGEEDGEVISYTYPPKLVVRSE